MLLKLLLVLLGLGIGAVVVTYLTMRRGIKYVRTIFADGQDRVLKLHFNHWFPRWRRAFDVTQGGHIWFQDSAPDSWQRGSGVGSLNPNKVQREMVAHAIGHVVEEILEGTLRYVARSLFEIVTQWKWRRRGGEERARRAENPISQGTMPGVDPIPWLDDFPDHWPGSEA